MALSNSCAECIAACGCVSPTTSSPSLFVNKQGSAWEWGGVCVCVLSMLTRRQMNLKDFISLS